MGSWMGVPKKRCKSVGCKKRVRMFQEIGLCNKCVEKRNEEIEKGNKKNKKRFG